MFLQLFVFIILFTTIPIFIFLFVSSFILNYLFLILITICLNIVNFGTFLVQSILIIQFIVLQYCQTHQMIDNMHGYGPLRVVYVDKVLVFLYYLLALSQHLLVVKFRVITALEIQSPALLLRVVPFLEHLVDLIEHLKMLSFE
jgi:hypothetical protein